MMGKAIMIMGLVLIGSAPAETLLPFEDTDTLEEIRYKIDYNGYCFEVSDTWIYRLSQAEKKNFFSRQASRTNPAFEFEQNSNPGPLSLIRRELPLRFDWRDLEGKSYIGPIRNQGECGSCYAFAAAAAAEGTYNVATKSYDSNRVNFSESYIMWCLGSQTQYIEYFFGCDGADFDYQELAALCEVGITYESNYPYRVNDPGTCNIWEYPRVKFKEWHRIGCHDIEAIKTALMTYGPLDAAVAVGTAFQAYSGGIYDDTLNSCYYQPCYYTSTNHAIALVGWDDDPPEGGGGCWILRNSWGESWGEDGYMRIRYTAARVACEATYLVYESIDPPPPVRKAPGDYNGDGTTDLAVFRPDRGLWKVRAITSAYFGAQGDQPVPGDYDGDGTWDLAYFRPSSGLWRVRGQTKFYFGTKQDFLVPADYDGDGRCDPAYFRASTGYWKIRGGTSAYFGAQGDQPVPGDYDGDGAWDLAYFRPSSGLWKIREKTSFYFGSSSDLVVPGDYDGDGAWDPAYVRPDKMLWRVRNQTRAYFGQYQDLPVPGDYDGDGSWDFACFRSSNILWVIKEGSRVYFGNSGDIFLVP